MALGTTIRIAVSSTVAGALSGFRSLQAAMLRAAATARVAASRMTSAFIARGGIPGVLGPQIARATAMLGRLAGVAGRAGAALLRAGGRAASTAAPYALLAAKVLLAVSAILTLTGAAANLAGAVQLIAPAAIAAGAGMIVWKMAAQGVFDAISAYMSGDDKKFEKSFGRLGLSAQGVVLTLIDLAREWKRTQLTVQERFWAGARNDLIAVSRALQPIADRWLPRIATAFATARHMIRYVLTEAAKSGQLDKIMSGVTRFFQGLLNSLAPLARAFLDIAEVASGSFGDIGVGISGAAQKFSDWIREMKNNGTLKRWLDDAKKAWAELGKIAENLGKFLSGIFGASNEEGQSFLEKLTSITGKMAEWANSKDGQKIIDTLAKIVGWLIACEPALDFIANRIGWIATQFGVLWEVAKLVWDGILGLAKGAIMWIINGWGWVLGAVEKAFGWVPGLGEKLKAAKKSFDQFRDGVNESLNGIQKTIDITVNYRARMIGNHLVSGSQQSGTYSSGIGGRASGGLASGLKWVGEYGPELADFGTGGRVYNNGQSRRMAMQATGATQVAMPTLVLESGPGSMGAAAAQMVNAALKGGHLRLVWRKDGTVVAAR